MPTDLDIARSVPPLPIGEIAQKIGIGEDRWEPYGRDVAKLSLDTIDEFGDKPRAKYVLVTAITPTPLGEGKTTTTVGLGQAFSHIGRTATIAIRQPSMGPTFGIKGGAAGGGFSQVIPMEKLNLHLTGDMHAVTAAHNLLAALVDNHIFRNSEVGLVPHRITWKRVLDVNDRALRQIIVGLGGAVDGVPRQTGFDITAASEVMAVLALATSLSDLRQRLGRMVVGWRQNGTPISADDIDGGGAMAVLLKDALSPNLLQTLEHTPALVHAGPFGNIAHGNSSVVADLIGIGTADVLVTEAGFGSDMGAERFFNIKCRASGLKPDAAVVVATVRALKAHSGKYRIVAGRPLPAELLEENPDDVLAGADNLRQHLRIVSKHGVTPVVAINYFPTDHASEVEAIRSVAQEAGVRAAVSTHHADGGRGAVGLAQAVWEAASAPTEFQMLYPDRLGLVDKITRIGTEIYGAHDVSFTAQAEKEIDQIEQAGWSDLAVCIAKTHLSISSDPTLKGAPTGWTLPIRSVKPSVGAGFAYALAGGMRTMPGLSASPAAERIGLDESGQIVGLS